MAFLKRRWLRKLRAFTILELIICAVVVVILASVAMVGYQGYRDRVHIMICETNQEIQQTAVKLFAYDTGALPGSLTELKPQHLHRAYAMVTTGRKPYTALAFLKETGAMLLGQSQAFAQNHLPPRYYDQNLETITCPSDATPPTGFDAQSGRPTGGTSYEINAAFSGAPLAVLLNPANADAVLIFETDVHTASGANPDDDRVYRHGRGKVCVQTTVGGRRRRRFRSGGGGSGFGCF